jgi:hypothetical protein
MGYLHDLCFGRFCFENITDDKATNEMVRRLILLCEQEDRRSSF